MHAMSARFRVLFVTSLFVGAVFARARRGAFTCSVHGNQPLAAYPILPDSFPLLLLDCGNTQDEQQEEEQQQQQLGPCITCTSSHHPGRFPPVHLFARPRSSDGGSMRSAWLARRGAHIDKGIQPQCPSGSKSKCCMCCASSPMRSRTATPRTASLSHRSTASPRPP